MSYPKTLIKNNFSKHARYYDRYASLQSAIANKLVDKIEYRNFRHILELGCGTGNYTKKIVKKFPDSRLKAVDISPSMLKYAKLKLYKNNNIDFIVGDAEDLEFDINFDLITSNATFQWFNMLNDTLKKYRIMLHDKGVIFFTTLGPNTFIELNEIIKTIFSKHVLSSEKFIDKTVLAKQMNQIYKEADIETITKKIKYNSLVDLLKSIKYTGTRGTGMKGNHLWTPNMLKKLEYNYLKKFKEIIATYEIIFCRGIK